MKITTIGIDLSKQSYSLHGVDAHGKVMLRKTLTRAKLLEFMAQLPPCLVGLEACGGAHDMARRLMALKHEVRIMAAKFVHAYRKNQKNDGNDAEAICEAVARPQMRFVPVKSTEQQAVLSVHRIRGELVRARTAMINQLRGLLSEFGVVLPKGRYQFRAHVGRALTAAEVPQLAQEVLEELNAQILQLDSQILAYDRRLEALARQSEAMRRVMAVRGVGPVSASAIVASVADAKLFKNGRQFAAWLGLVPRQYSTGGKPRLGRITKCGDVYLRTLLVHGARAALTMMAKREDRLARWTRSLVERRGFKKACVALAAKNARTIWALLAKGEAYRIEAATA
jgi:transposase